MNDSYAQKIGEGSMHFFHGGLADGLIIPLPDQVASTVYVHCEGIHPDLVAGLDLYLVCEEPPLHVPYSEYHSVFNNQFNFVKQFN